VPVGEESMTMLEPRGFDLGELDGRGSPCEAVDGGELEWNGKSGWGADIGSSTAAWGS
jgi:hypothetical protein